MCFISDVGRIFVQAKNERRKAMDEERKTKMWWWLDHPEANEWCDFGENENDNDNDVARIKNNGIKFKCHDFYGWGFFILRNVTMNVSAFFQCHFVLLFVFFGMNLLFSSLFGSVCRWSDTRSWQFSIRLWKFSLLFSFLFFVAVVVVYCSIAFSFIFGYNFGVIYLELFYSSIFNSIWCTLVCVFGRHCFRWRWEGGELHTCNGHIYNLVNCNHCHYRVATHCKFKLAFVSAQADFAVCFFLYFYCQFSLWYVFQQLFHLSHGCDLVQSMPIPLSLVSFRSDSRTHYTHTFSQQTNKNAVRLSVCRMLDIRIRLHCFIYSLLQASFRFWFGLIVFWGGFLCLSLWKNAQCIGLQIDIVCICRQKNVNWSFSSLFAKSG